VSGIGEETHFFLSGQLCACSGSSGPSNSTSKSSTWNVEVGRSFPATSVSVATEDLRVLCLSVVPTVDEWRRWCVAILSNSVWCNLDSRVVLLRVLASSKPPRSVSEVFSELKDRPADAVLRVLLVERGEKRSGSASASTLEMNLSTLSMLLPEKIQPRQQFKE
jgi:hypothetical protein